MASITTTRITTMITLAAIIQITATIMGVTDDLQAGALSSL
jgi:hypothetical protein